MTSTVEPLVAVVTTDLSAITRGRLVVESDSKIAATGVGWLQANLSLTPFNSIVDPNPWGSSGDLRLLPDLKARFRTTHDRVGDALRHGHRQHRRTRRQPWVGCTRTMLKEALAALKAATGLSVIAAFEQEFHVADASFAPAPLACLVRRAAPRRSVRAAI